MTNFKITISRIENNFIMAHLALQNLTSEHHHSQYPAELRATTITSTTRKFAGLRWPPARAIPFIRDPALGA